MPFGRVLARVNWIVKFLVGSIVEKRLKALWLPNFAPIPSNPHGVRGVVESV
jgi:hypothetical protein